MPNFNDLTAYIYPPVMQTTADLKNALVPSQPAERDPFPKEAPAIKKDNEMSRYNDQVEIYNNVDIEAPTSEITRQRDHLERRADTIFWHKGHELENQFGLRDDDAPKGLDEWTARIKSGKYKIDERRKESHDWWYHIRWRDPEMKEDMKGYEAAMDVLRKKLTAVQDIIVIHEPEEALKAVQDFETWTYKKK